MAFGLLALAMYISCIFHVVCASFSALATQKLADAEANSNRIWALYFIISFIKLPSDNFSIAKPEIKMNVSWFYFSYIYQR